MPATTAETATVQPRIVKKRCAPKTWPCALCGRRGRRERTRTHEVRHLGHKEPVIWEVTVGVYHAKCDCLRTYMREVRGRLMPVRKRVRYFTSTVDGVDVGAEFTDEVRQKVVDLVVRDRLPNSLVIQHLKEDFSLDISVGYIYLCLDWAKKGAA
jgi:hypothetical protein